VTKKLLCGTFSARDRELAGSLGTAPVVVERAIRGWAVWPAAGAAHPVFLSPGHRLSVAWIANHLQALWGPRRLPAPIYWADRHSRRAAATEGAAG
jgi:deoxyinosine 3'endonuclease (endonuclease V)